jgi:hypothetical protein
MKISEMFIGRRCRRRPSPPSTTPAGRVRLAPLRPAAFASAAGRRSVRISNLHTRALLEPQLSFGHDALARPNAFLDDDVVAHTLPGRDRPLFNRGLVGDDEDERAVLADLHRLLRNHSRVGSVSSSSVTRANCPARGDDPCCPSSL